MLSGETSVGDFPVETVCNMRKIIDNTEYLGEHFYRKSFPVSGTSTFQADSICLNAAMLAKETKAKAIIAFTHSGYTAFRISSHRPAADIFAFTNNKKILHYLNLLWGVSVFYTPTYKHLEEAISESVNILKKKNMIAKGDCVIHVGSSPLNRQGQTNIVKVSNVL